MTQTSTIQIKEPKAPATTAQVNFLESLLKERECPSVAERYAFAKGFLTKGAASTLIGEAKAAPKKVVATGQFVVAEVPVTQFPKNPEVLTLDGCPAFGYYEIAGIVYYWDVTGKDGFPTLRRLTKVTQYNGVVKGSWKKVFAPYGSPKVSATYTPFAGKGYTKTEITKTVSVPKAFAQALLESGAQPMSMEQAAAQGKMMGFCIRCGATLTDPESVAAGIGPVCKTYWF